MPPTPCCPCCVNTYNLGCFSACGLILLIPGVVGLGEDGEWKFIINFGRASITIVSDLQESDPISFEKEGLNEVYTYTGSIYRPDGTRFEHVDSEGVIYDCFQFTTKTTI